ncbi:heparinase II/III family protein [candidate division KSB1 bacterium]|nr:heparinase II/III family protein [candidate division KSB1 bacterium]
MKLQKTSHIMFVICIFILAGIGNTQIEGIPNHPRIILQVGDEKVLRTRISQSEMMQELHDRILVQADAMLTLQEVKREQIGRRLLGISRTCLKRVIALSYAYRMTKDFKYLDKAESEMLAASRFSDWNPSHFLDVAEMTMALAIGYDWLYPDLSKESRQIIKKAILNKGLHPSLKEENTWFLQAEHNWNQVCNAGMVFGALAIYEDEPELASTIIKNAKRSIALPDAEYEPDGAYPEGANYWGYGTTFHVLLIDAYESVWPDKQDLIVGDGFIKSAKYYLHVHGPTGSYNYADCRYGKGLAPAVFWFANRTNDPGLLWYQKELIEKMIQKEKPLEATGLSNRFLPMMLIWGSRLDSLNHRPPSELSWMGQGKNPVSLHRTSWDDDAIFIGIKGGSPGINHGHMDIGSFVMDALGVRWAMDLGMHNYNRLEMQGVQLWDRSPEGQRWQIYRYSNLSHNTLVVDDAPQIVNAEGMLLKHSDEDPDFMYTVVDMSPVYAEQLSTAIRGIAIVDSEYVMVRDELSNNDATSIVRWGMVTHDSVEMVDELTAIIQKEGKSLTFQVVQPSDAKIQLYSTDPQNDFEDKNPGTVMLGFETELAPNQEKDLIVLLIPEGTNPPKQIRTTKLVEW